MSGSPRIAVLVMAAGAGRRAGGGMPKQFRPVLGRSLLQRSLDALAAALPGARLQVVIGEGQDWPGAVIGGDTRAESVRRGLQALRIDPPDLVLIHDAARPFVTPEAIHRVVAALETVDGAAPGVPVTDSLKRADTDGTITDEPPRDGLWRVQTPQGFRFAPLLAAFDSAFSADATDDLAIARAAGLSVRVVEGNPANVKITTERDFADAEAHLLRALGDVRSGSGFDVHTFGPGDHVMLCGVRVPHSHGLVGHSDADVGLHAITDAILGAIGAGDIGQHFSPADERWRGADSRTFLKHAASLVMERGGVVAHCDVTIICEAPKVGPHRSAMIAAIAETLTLTPDRISVKATTTERLGFTGRREGMAAMATATVRLPL